MSIGLNLTYGMKPTKSVTKKPTKSVTKQKIPKIIASSNEQIPTDIVDALRAINIKLEALSKTPTSRAIVFQLIYSVPNKTESLPIESNAENPIEEVKEDMVIEEEVLNTDEEEKITKELGCWKDFNDFSNEIGMLDSSDKETLLKHFDRLKELYDQYFDIKEYMKKNTSFFFCCGLFAFYLSGEVSGTDILKTWFLENLGIEMTPKNAIDLIRKSPGDSAYFFLTSLEDHA